MAVHDYVRAGNVWASLSDLTAAEMAALDFNAADSISATGGTYALTEDLVIGGAPGVSLELDLYLQSTASAIFSGDNFEVYSNSIVLGTTTSVVSIDGDATFNELTTFNGQVIFNDYAHFLNNIEVEGLTYLNGDVHVGGIATFIDDVSIAGLLSVANEATFDGGAVFTLGSTYLSPLTLGAGGYIKRRSLIVTSSLPGDIGPLNYDDVLFASSFSVTGTPLTYAIQDADDGAAMTLVTESSSNGIIILSPGGAVVLGLLLNAAGSTGPNVHKRRIEIRRKGGAWFTFDSVDA